MKATKNMYNSGAKTTCADCHHLDMIKGFCRIWDSNCSQFDVACKNHIKRQGEQSRVEETILELRRRIAELESSQPTQAPVSPKKAQTFQNQAGMFLRRRMSQIKKSTMMVYQNNFSSVLFPMIGSLAIEQIDNKKIQDVADNLATKRSLSSVRDLICLIRMVLTDAMREGDLAEFPFRQIRYPRVESVTKQRMVLTLTERGKLVEWCMNNVNRGGSVGVLLSVYTGMRIGEVCALKWADVDLVNDVLWVRGTLQRCYDSFAKKTFLLEGTPKSKSSVREIPISAALKDGLRKKDRIGEYVLSFNAPSRMEPRTMRTHFDNILTRCEIPRIKFHALRHTFISNAINNGGNIKAVSELAGHSNTGITLDTYTHIDSKAKRDVINIAGEA